MEAREHPAREAQEAERQAKLQAEATIELIDQRIGVALEDYNKTLRETLSYVVVFWALVATLGVKPAILGSIMFIACDALWRWRKRLKFTRLYLLVSALTLVFGFVDLVSTSPFMLKYEAAVSNAATGFAFVIGALGRKPIIQEAAEQRGYSFVVSEETRAFFRLFTLLWAAYFFLKAALFVWMTWTMAMLEAMALRSVIGGVSLGLMIAISVTQGRRLFFLCRSLGLLPKPDPPPEAQAPSPRANS